MVLSESRFPMLWIIVYYGPRVCRSSEVGARRKATNVEGWPLAADHGGDRSSRRTAGREADVLVTKRQPETGMPWRRSDHRQPIGQRQPRPAPGWADRLAKFAHASRRPHQPIELG